MKFYKSIPALAFVCFLSVPVLSQAPKLDVAGMGWMAGCWQSNDTAKKRLVTEQWMSPEGGLMLGMARTVRNGKAVDYEVMRIEERPDGIFFVAKPRASKEETPFKLKSSAANEVTFENPDHDFPQRVIYRLNGTTLTGRIEGNNNGKPAAIDFPMTKAKCP